MNSELIFSSLKESPNLDVNKWMSQLLKGLPEDGDVGELLDKLKEEVENEVKKTKDEIGSLCQKIVVQLPRVEREFEETHKEVNRLQKEIIVGFNEAENVQKKTTTSMNTLERLDNIKANLLATSAALHEADKWTSLGKDVDQFLDAGDVHKSYECIIGMENSLVVLDQATSEERRLILEEVKNRLEALATKHIIHAFETNDTENATRFFIMFTKLERTSQFIKYFENSEKIKLSQEWRNYVELLSFKDAITKFYDDLIDHLHSKMQWCKTIFTGRNDELSLNVLLGLYAETIQSLEPSIQYCFEVESKKQPFMEVLLQFNQISHRFVLNVRQFIESNCAGKPEPGKVLSLMQIVFAPFIPQYGKYSKYHENLVGAKIQSAVKTISSQSTSDISAVLQEKIECAKRLMPEIILGVKEGEEALMMLNFGLLYYHFGRGIDMGLVKLKDWCCEIFKMLERTSNSEKQRNILENTLSFGETCGEILQQIMQLDKNMTANCLKVIAKLSTPASSEWEDYSKIYVDPALLSEIAVFIKNKETLLQASTQQVKLLCKDATRLILNVTTEPIESLLKNNFVLNDCHLKDAIPSEYITQVAEHLMLLPQALDDASSGASYLTYAFGQTSEDEAKSPVDFILSNVSNNICEIYSEQLLKVSYLSDGQAKQLGQDIEYLNSVLEDLGTKLSPDLADLSRLMKIYPTLSDSTAVDKISTKIINAVKKMKIKPMPKDLQ